MQDEQKNKNPAEMAGKLWEKIEAIIPWQSLKEEVVKLVPELKVREFIFEIEKIELYWDREKGPVAFVELREQDAIFWDLNIQLDAEIEITEESIELSKINVCRDPRDPRF